MAYPTFTSQAGDLIPTDRLRTAANGQTYIGGMTPTGGAAPTSRFGGLSVTQRAMMGPRDMQGNLRPGYAPNGSPIGAMPTARKFTASGAFGSSPFLPGMADDITRRTNEMVGQQVADTRGFFSGVGGLGGSRGELMEGTAIAKGADYLSGNLARMYGDAWNQDENREVQRYGIDTSAETANRGLDLQQLDLGSQLYGRGVSGQWTPLNQTGGILAPYTGNGTTTSTSSSGGGWPGAVGGLLAGASFGRQMGWF
jgi:hypothetical protein